MRHFKRASIIFLILTLFLLFMNFRDAFYGNPISRYLANRQITNYISDYAHIKNFEVKTTYKDFKNGGYYIANVYDEDNNNKFIIEATERNVVSHTLEDIKQPTNVDETNYSPIILWVALIASFILFALSSIIFFYGALFKKEKKI